MIKICDRLRDGPMDFDNHRKMKSKAVSGGEFKVSMA